MAKRRARPARPSLPHVRLRKAIEDLKRRRRGLTPDERLEAARAILDFADRALQDPTNRHLR